MIYTVVICSLGWIAAAAASPGWIGKGHNSTDKRALKHQDNCDRERHAKRMGPYLWNGAA